MDSKIVRFFTTLSVLASINAFAKEPDCASAVALKVCPVSNYQDNQNDTQRACETDSSGGLYVQTVQEMYAMAPLFLQKVLCGVDKIYIEQGDEFIYDAWSLKYGGKNYMGFRGSIISKQISFANSLVSYDQHFFKGGKKDEVQTDLPHILEPTGMDSTAGALLALAGHEAGHLILFRWPALRSPWQNIAWTRSGSSVVIADTNVRSLSGTFCYPSSCKDAEKVERDQAEDVYRTLAPSSFPSIFSMIHPDEDFCESLMFYSIGKVATQLNYYMPNGKDTINMLNKIKQPSGHAFQPKSDFLKEVENKVLTEW